jgi:hypothetical protein
VARAHQINVNKQPHCGSLSPAICVICCLKASPVGSVYAGYPQLWSASDCEGTFVLPEIALFFFFLLPFVLLSKHPLFAAPWGTSYMVPRFNLEYIPARHSALVLIGVGVILRLFRQRRPRRSVSWPPEFCLRFAEFGGLTTGMWGRALAISVFVFLTRIRSRRIHGQSGATPSPRRCIPLRAPPMAPLLVQAD